MFSYTFEGMTQEAYRKLQESAEKDDFCHALDEGIRTEDCGLEWALLYGKLQRLFGACPFESQDLENQYTYYISTKNQAGDTILLCAYSGPTGPSTRGRQNEETLKAAKAFRMTLQDVEPADYDYKGYYFDFGTEISMGVRDGVPYYEESGGIDIVNMDWMSDLTEEEQEELRQLGLDREPDWE